MTRKEVSALKKGHFEMVKKELAYVGVAYVASLFIFKVAFFEQDLLTLFRLVSSLFWLYVLPGYSMMLYWKGNLSLLERSVVGTSLSFAVVGMLSYYLGLFGLNISYHVFVLPFLFIAGGLYFSTFNEGGKEIKNIKEQ